MSDRIVKGSVSQTIEVFIKDSSSTTGAGLTGLAYNTAGLTAYYYRQGAAAATAITLATMTLGTWATGGFVVVDGTNAPGLYQLGLPDAAVAGGADYVDVYLKGATNMVQTVARIQLDNRMRDTIRTGTAQAGAAGTITLDSGASATNDFYKGALIYVREGTGAGQVPTICTAYVGSTKVATVSPNWITTPDNTSKFEVAAQQVSVVTFPANFSALSINASGHITRVTLADTLTTYTGNTPQTGDSFARIGATGSGLISLASAATLATVAGYLDTEIAAILEDTGTTLDTKLNSIISLLDDARTEPGQGAPPVNPDTVTKIDYLYKAWRNKKTNDGTTTILYADNGTTVDQKQTTSEAAGTVSKAEWVSGP